jgi:hypothetical protein
VRTWLDRSIDPDHADGLIARLAAVEIGPGAIARFCCALRLRGDGGNDHRGIRACHGGKDAGDDGSRDDGVRHFEGMPSVEGLGHFEHDTLLLSDGRRLFILAALIYCQNKQAFALKLC